MNRRTFLTGGAAAGLMAGCRSLPLAEKGPLRPHRDYWCTWETQRALWKGKTCERDNLSEDILFGKDGWARLYPECREGLCCVLDDGWDVPYGATSEGAGNGAFGSLDPDPSRFPSLKGTRVQKLRELRRRVEDLGWRGIGFWIPTQSCGEYAGHAFGREALAEDLKRRLADSAEAGVLYWKVDWGVHSRDLWYREMMSALAADYAPDIIVDHAIGFDNALNGVAHPFDGPKPADGIYDFTGKTGRMIGNPLFEGIRKIYTDVIAFSDSFSTYDLLQPMTAATAVERAVFQLACADATRSPCTINTDDELVLAAGLGLGAAPMRAANWPEPKVPEPQPKQRRIAEVARLVRWRKFAPVFGSACGCPVRYGAATAEENWSFAPHSTWWSQAFGRTFFQKAPSVTSRGLPLPSVRDAGEHPLVSASCNPYTGALAVASLPILTQAKGRHTPLADVELDAVLRPSVPLGVFGDVKSLTLRDGAPSARVRARDLFDGAWHDVTAQCGRSDGKIVLPGDLLTRIGTERNPGGDCSSAGTLVELS